MNADGHLYKAVRKHGDVADVHPRMDFARAFEDKTKPEEPDYGPLKERVALIQD